MERLLDDWFVDGENFKTKLEFFKEREYYRCEGYGKTFITSYWESSRYEVSIKECEAAGFSCSPLKKNDWVYAYPSQYYEDIVSAMEFKKPMLYGDVLESQKKDRDQWLVLDADMTNFTPPDIEHNST